MTLHVSVTGLTLRSPAFAPLFWWHALRSMAQAKGAPGLVRVDARRIDGVHHTLTIWQDEASMRAYLKAGAHLKAMQAFRRIAAGRTFGCQAETAPDWAEAHRLWKEQGRAVKAEITGGPPDVVRRGLNAVAEPTGPAVGFRV